MPFNPAAFRQALMSHQSAMQPPGDRQNQIQGLGLPHTQPASPNPSVGGGMAMGGNGPGLSHSVLLEMHKEHVKNQLKKVRMAEHAGVMNEHHKQGMKDIDEEQDGLFASK